MRFFKNSKLRASPILPILPVSQKLNVGPLGKYLAVAHNYNHVKLYGMVKESAVETTLLAKLPLANKE